MRPGQPCLSPSPLFYCSLGFVNDHHHHTHSLSLYLYHICQRGKERGTKNLEFAAFLSTPEAKPQSSCFLLTFFIAIIAPTPSSSASTPPQPPHKTQTIIIITNKDERRRRRRKLFKALQKDQPQLSSQLKLSPWYVASDEVRIVFLIQRFAISISKISKSLLLGNQASWSDSTTICLCMFHQSHI